MDTTESRNEPGASNNLIETGESDQGGGRYLGNNGDPSSFEMPEDLIQDEGQNASQDYNGRVRQETQCDTSPRQGTQCDTSPRQGTQGDTSPRPERLPDIEIINSINASFSENDDKSNNLSSTQTDDISNVSTTDNDDVTLNWENTGNNTLFVPDGHRKVVFNSQNVTFHNTSDSDLSHITDDPETEGVTNIGYTTRDGISTDAIVDSSETLDSTTSPKSVGFFRLFRFADGVDVLLMLVGTLGAMACGTAFQINFLVYGRILDLFIENVQLENNMTSTSNVTAAREAVFVQMQSTVTWFAIIGACIVVCASLEMSLWVWTSERQTRRMREAVFWAILNKDQGWFDKQHVGELTAMLIDDTQAIQNGMGDKFAKMLEWLSCFAAAYIIGFVRGWKLTLVILAVLPLLGVVVAMLTKVTRKLTSVEIRNYGTAGAIAEEVLSAIRTVVAYGGEKKEVERYACKLESARGAGIRKAFFSGLFQGLVWFGIFGAFSLAFWYGTKLVGEGEYTGGEVLQIFMGMLQGTTAIGQAIPSLEIVAIARSSAERVFHIIDKESEIDSNSPGGAKPSKFEGLVEFCNVSFSFPTRRSVKILNGLSFSVDVGQTIALVGSSGSGKSTVIQLLQRFYDPDAGEIKIDGRRLPDVNVQWLRRQVGVVSQEPILFATTISENIRMGHLEATQAEIIRAAKEANAHDFIMALPKQYETMIGERGAQLSGGQKQRIAIARALVRDPSILLLDEATSALDTQSEAMVQLALNKASKGRTTLVVAHRLSTVKNADKIVSLKDGRIIEEGTHRELMSQRGQYYKLVKSQNRATREVSMDSIDGLDGPALAEEILSPTKSRSQSFRRLDSAMSFRRMGSGRGSSRSNLLLRSASVLSQREEEKEVASLPAPSMSRILKLNYSETPRMVAGCIGAILMGATTPAFSVALSEVVRNFATSDLEAMSRQSVFLSLMFLAIGTSSCLGMMMQNYFFGTAGESLTLKIRKLMFAAMLKQEIGWFDEPGNQVGALTSKLANDASRIKGAAGQQFGLVVQAITNMGTAIVIAFTFGAKLAGVIFVFIPLMFISGLVQGKISQDSTKESMVDLDQAAQVASEAIDNIRTVAALNRERHFQQQYNKYLKNIYRKARKSAFAFGIVFGISQSILYFAYAATFGYGTVLVQSGEMEFYNVFRIFACLIFGSMLLGRALSWMPDYSKAKVAAAKILSLLDRDPLVANLSDGGATMADCRGDLSFLGVTFRYPTRQDVKVLSGLSLSIPQGQTVALVGASGCGKSTAIQLLERFYDPVLGCVCLDGENLVTLNLPWLRSLMGLVSQEPVLFDLTIRQNIAYGDNSREVSMDEVMEAAKLANIHSFIENLPLGYETNVGEKGTQLSGGQKQRVAIARALVRKPKILLLDEATSALDTESEKVVQEALDQARQGRTCIVIAHRLSTIQNADLIVVIHSGQVLEQGCHDDLMDRRGFYYELHKAHRRGKSLRKS